jgi:hypothetical protein
MLFGYEGRLDSSQLTSEEKPTFGGSNEAVPMPVIAFRPR